MLLTMFHYLRCVVTRVNIVFIIERSKFENYLKKWVVTYKSQMKINYTILGTTRERIQRPTKNSFFHAWASPSTKQSQARISWSLSELVVILIRNILIIWDIWIAVHNYKLAWSGNVTYWRMRSLVIRWGKCGLETTATERNHSEFGCASRMRTELRVSVERVF